MTYSTIMVSLSQGCEVERVPPAQCYLPLPAQCYLPLPAQCYFKIIIHEFAVNFFVFTEIRLSIDAKSTATLLTNTSLELTNIRRRCARTSSVHLHPFVTGQAGSLV